MPDADADRIEERRARLILHQVAVGRKHEGVSGMDARSLRAITGTPGMGVNLWGASPLYEDESLKEGGQRL